MEIDRRTAIKLLASVAVGVSGLGSIGRSRVAANTLALRTVTSTDAPFIQAIMNMCVTGDGAFHGKCGEWSLEWATESIARCPETVVLTLGDLPVAFMEVPTVRPPLPPLAADASDAKRARYALRDKRRLTLQLSAAGVRTDVLSAADQVAMFRRVLYYGFRAARRQGFVQGEGHFPWEQHPHMPRRWTDYPGCVLVEAPSVSAVDGRAVYWLRWDLDDTIQALEAEGAGVEALDVA